MQASKTSILMAALLAAGLMAGCDTLGIKSPGAESTSTDKPADKPADQSAAKPAAKPAAKAEPALLSGYTCCNMRYESGNDWINELNYVGWPMIPLGTEASLSKYGRYRASATIGGKPMRIGQDYTREQLSLEQYMARWIVKDDPKVKLATFPANIQAAIKAGKVLNGMTREQVIMSVGYPLTQENPDLEAPMWRMWVSSFGEYQLMWENGKVKDIIADPVTKNMIVHQ